MGNDECGEALQASYFPLFDIRHSLFVTSYAYHFSSRKLLR